MDNFDRYWRIIPNQYGIILMLCLIGFFLLMRLLGLAQIFELRTLNVLFVFVVIYSAISKFHKQAGASYYQDFFDFFKIGIRTGMIGIIGFAGFLAIYLDILDPNFMELLKTYGNAGGIMSPVIAAFAVIIEGMASAVISSFIIIQVMKSKTVEKPAEKPSH